MPVFASRLRAARKQRNLKQAELAQRIGLRPSAISNFEAGGRTPTFHNLRKLADTLEVTTDYLMGREGGDTLYRGLGRLSDEERDIANSFIKTLLDRQKTRNKQKDE